MIAMLAFAANSILARLAFSTAAAEPLSYTGIRLAAGAVTLALLLLLRREQAWPPAGCWSAAAALAGYALFFSLAYVLLGAGTGALILFASVQIGILAWAVHKGDRPGLLEWAGLVIAFCALGYLVSPGLVAPHPLGALMMVVAGLCWAGYTLIGRGSRSPVSDTGGNFLRTAPFAIVLILAGLFTKPLDPLALGYAIASGALASGIGYAVWYAVLPALSRVRAAIVQLTVPAIAATGGVLLIAEPLTLRLVIASLGILGGVAFALIAGERRRART
ncbi:MAG: DMT family transporter [Devosia sp.]